MFYNLSRKFSVLLHYISVSCALYVHDVLERERLKKALLVMVGVVAFWGVNLD